MEQPEPIGEEPPQPQDSPLAVPTQQDHDNAVTRQAIAERQMQDYCQVLLWALGAFGPGFVPSHRHFLVSKEEEERVRYTGERPTAAATVYTVKNAEGVRRHFTIVEGQVVEHESYEAGFGSMLLEPHPTRGFEHRGVFYRTHRYNLCFAPFVLYEPKSAEQLAALRISRERGKAAREERRFQEENPLLAWSALNQQNEDESPTNQE